MEKHRRKKSEDENKEKLFISIHSSLNVNIVVLSSSVIRPHCRLDPHDGSMATATVHDGDFSTAANTVDVDRCTVLGHDRDHPYVVPEDSDATVAMVNGVGVDCTATVHGEFCRKLNATVDRARVRRRSLDHRSGRPPCIYMPAQHLLQQCTRCEQNHDGDEDGCGSWVNRFL